MLRLFVEAVQAPPIYVGVCLDGGRRQEYLEETRTRTVVQQQSCKQAQIRSPDAQNGHFISHEGLDASDL